MTETECLHSCPLFRGLAEEDLSAALDFFEARRASYRKGEAVMRPGESPTCFALVLKGAVQVLQDDVDGHHMIMAQAVAGDTFGESLCFLRETESPVYALALSRTELLWLSGRRLHAPAASDLAFELSARFTAMLARRTLSMNDRIQVLSRHSLRDKILTHLLQCARKAGSRCFDVPFSRTDWAVYLGVNRSALGRELTRMKAECLLDFEKRRFTLP